MTVGELLEQLQRYADQGYSSLPTVVADRDGFADMTGTAAVSITKDPDDPYGLISVELGSDSPTAIYLSRVPNDHGCECEGCQS